LIAVFCILSWRIFWITMLNRCAPESPPTLALDDTEIGLLGRLVKDETPPRLGGYLARATDPPPGNTVMWRGLSRLMDIKLGVIIGMQYVDN